MKKISLLKIVSFAALCIMLVFTLGLLGGCKGSDGSQGAQGIQGPQGNTGPSGPQGPAGTSATTFGTHSLLQGRVDATVSNIVVSNIGGVPKVSFNIATADGPYAALTQQQMALYLADLVPSGTVSAATHTSYSTDYFEQWANEHGDQTGHSGFTPMTPGATFDNSDAANGNYSWTFSAPFGTATAGSGLTIDDYSASHVQRLILRITGDTAINNTVGIQDFNVPAAGADATALTPQRAFVTIDTCKKCHSKYMDNAAHASSYLDTRACDICHSPLYGSSRHTVGFMDTANVILPVFIHQIHASIPNPNGPTVEYPVSYPQEINNCVTCHADPDNIGADQIDNWKTHPTARVCSSCHTGNQMQADGRSMIHDPSFVVSGPSPVPSGVMTDAQCSLCHGSAGTANDYQDIVTVHDASPTGLLATGWDIPEYNVTISMPTPSNNSYFVSGETFTVDVTLAANPDFAGTATSIPAVYTDPTDTAYIAGNGLHVASLYIYGPRSHAVPLLGTQGLSLFGTGDATGFHYPVTVPANAAPGTYMVRARIADYSYNRNNPAGGGTHTYQAESYALAHIQIGTATVQDKIDGGTDAEGSVCFNCHGNTKMHANDHAAPFDTDHCTACHDLSGGHGDPIANRVHAVHSANVYGDLSISDPTNPGSRDWTEITYPSNIERCVVCHSSGNISYKTNLYEIPCYGCHADATGAPQSHMATMGGIISGFTATTDFSSESCAVCHGPGRDVSISD